MFGRYTSLQNLNGLKNWNVSNGTVFKKMFNLCNALKNLNLLQNWNFSKFLKICLLLVILYKI